MRCPSHFALFFAGLAALAILSCSGDKVQDPETYRVTTPDFILVDTQGDTFQLSKEVGRAHLINFFIMNCPVCQGEVDTLNALYNEYHNRGLEIIGIVLNHNNDLDEVKAFMDWKQIKYRMFLDDGRTSLGYGVLDRVPLNRVVDWEGWTVYDRIVVDLDGIGDELRTAIKLALPPLGN